MEPTLALFRSTMSTLGIFFSLPKSLRALPLGAAHHHITTVWSGNGTLDSNQILFHVDADHFQIADGDLRVAHAPGHLHARKDAGRKTGGADRTSGAVKHGTMAGGTAAEVMALHQAGETATFAQANHVDHVFRLELI